MSVSCELSANVSHTTTTTLGSRIHVFLVLPPSCQAGALLTRENEQTNNIKELKTHAGCV